MKTSKFMNNLLLGSTLLCSNLMGYNYYPYSTNIMQEETACSCPEEVETDCDEARWADLSDHQGTLWLDFLFFRIDKDNLDYAITNITSSGGPRGSIKCLEPDWSGGFRFGLAKNWNDCNVLSASYLRYSENTSAITTSDNATLISTKLHPSAFGVGLTDLSSVSAFYAIDFHSTEVEIGPTWQLDDETGYFRTFGGIIVTCCDQKMITKYSTTDDLTTPYDEILDLSELDFYGIHAGFEWNWDNICDCWGLYSKLSGNICYTTANISVQEKSVTSTEEIVVNVHKKQNFISPSYATLLGVALDLSCCHLNGKIVLGYEIQGYLCLPDFITFVDELAFANIPRNMNSLNLSGLTARLSTCF